LLFAPGGSHSGDFHPIVTMSRNMLPFEWRELRRYRLSWTSLRLLLLRRTQSRSFRQADGLIFLTQYARDGVMRAVKTSAAQTAIIPHGVDGRFVRAPREQLPIGSYSADRPFRILYVSIVNLYKHQWHVAEAVAQLRAEGLPVLLELAGPAYPPALARLKTTLGRVDPAAEFVRYLGGVPYGGLHTLYARADLCVFASSCENLPNILLEGMASGLPIACSNRGPMPEVLGDAGVYFDPEDPNDIARALHELIESPMLRSRLAQASFERAPRYSWRRCADETLSFLAEVARSYRREKGQSIRP
jgi:glycosyltransferase involved in cell wall biosynthesis